MTEPENIYPANREAVVKWYADFVTASVVDPFVNILGIMTNPYYIEIPNAKDACK